METLVLAALATGQAQAAPLSLQDARITATYNGSAADVLGLDHLFAREPGSNTSTLDPTNSGVEFLTADFLFGFDFGADGTLVIYDNMPVPAGDYKLTFDFGATLPGPITSFTLLDGSAVDGVPGLSVVDGHTIGVDLGGLAWHGDFGSITARIGAADVPEPAAPALLLAGAAGLAFSRRARRTRRN
nr:PEP-CTERM sorting domain-containing protein [Massilia sp. PDC64]